ncbi:MAG: hypothetical protein AVDCRST_MAG41-2566, partial [uncultured Corynebacteriales bacterium]
AFRLQRHGGDPAGRRHPHRHRCRQHRGPPGLPEERGRERRELRLDRCRRQRGREPAPEARQGRSGREGEHHLLLPVDRPGREELLAARGRGPRRVHRRQL